MYHRRMDRNSIVREEILAYAVAVAGTQDDLDEMLESAAVEFLQQAEPLDLD